LALNLSYHNLAEVEIDSSLTWYEERSRQAFDQFRIRLTSALNSIPKFPERFPCIYGEFRSARVKKFPYKVIFRIEQDQLFVIALAHDKRDPDYWKDRVS
jgi:hypothetical protein